MIIKVALINVKVKPDTEAEKVAAEETMAEKQREVAEREVEANQDWEVGEVAEERSKSVMLSLIKMMILKMLVVDCHDCHDSVLDDARYHKYELYNDLVHQVIVDSKH